MFDTSLLDQAWAEQKSRWEWERQSLLKRLRQWLDVHGAQYNVERAYIFGSLATPNRFNDLSDIDLAVTAAASDRILALMAALARALGREVDVVILSQCHFAQKIRREGMLWTPSD